MPYTPLFDPSAAAQPFQAERAYRLGDRGPAGEADRYEYSPEIELAVNVALAAGRPLLVRGRPGTGKSSLARSVATLLGWRYYAMTVSSRTTARDLLWTFDSVARLADAQAGSAHIRHRSAYVSPGVLWWAFDPDSARQRGLDRSERSAAEGRGFSEAVDPSPSGDPDRAVVLIDEIDKADPDVPNDLLVPLGSFQFAMEDRPPVVARNPPLVIITTNEERDLPKAFLRRCVILALADPSRERLGKIARRHFPAAKDAELGPLLDEYERVNDERQARGEPRPSVAELLDALAACRNLGSPPGADRWPGLASLLLDKATEPVEAP
jgi:MoxR-like ATPase